MAITLSARDLRHPYSEQSHKATHCNTTATKIFAGEGSKRRLEIT